MTVGLIIRWGSCWIGLHWSRKHKRLCINPLPCVTVWIVAVGGDVPRKEEM